MKLSKQELKQKISDSIKDNDELVIELLEDIEDSMIEDNQSVMDETKQKEYDDLKFKYETLQEKYKQRFLSGNDDEGKDDEENDDELKEEEVIDVKEI